MYAFAADGTLDPLGKAVMVGQVSVETGVPSEPADAGPSVGANLGGRERAGLGPVPIAP
jgi:hypothetical protein